MRYQLKLRNTYAGGCLDLGGGDKPCTKCAWFGGFSAEDYDNHGEMQSVAVGYICKRYVTLDEGGEFTCAFAREDSNLCGHDAIGWQPVPEHEAESRAASLDLGVGPSCDACAHRLPDTFRPDGTSIASKIMVRLCGRFVVPLTGAPMTCTDCRSDPRICGMDGVGFELPVAPERDLETLRANRFSVPHLPSHATDAVAGSASCFECKYARLDVKDPMNPDDDELVCIRYVDPVSGDPLLCGEARKYTGICGLEGAGFEPVEEAA